MREKKIWKKAAVMGAAALLAGVLLGCTAIPAAAEEASEEGRILRQSAVWTDPKDFRGLLEVEASGPESGGSVSLCLSEYFLLDETEKRFPQGFLTEEEVITNQENRETTVTKIIYEPKGQAGETLHLSIPVFLRREYAFPERDAAYPVTREPLSPLLPVPAARRDLEVVLEPKEKERKPGQNLWYRVTLTNTGDVSLENILLTAELPGAQDSLLWSAAPNLERTNASAVLRDLEKGETRSLSFSAETKEDMTGTLACTVTAKAGEGSAQVHRSAAAETELLPLKAAFEVEKTADLTQAQPGDIVTYQICIRNTGERTLHSVVTTERFQHAEIRAQFLEAEGVRLNSTRTQAMISRLRPGDTAHLKAEVILPEEIKDQELLNQVIVTTEETGESAVRSEAEVKIREGRSRGNTDRSGPETRQRGKTAPKTGDRSGKALFEVLLLASVLASAAAAARLIWKERIKTKH